MVFTACSGGDRSENIVADRTGEEIYKKSCATCHGQDLSGGAGPSLQNISEKYGEEDIKHIINNGIGTMFPVNLPDENVELLIDWLETEN